MDCDLDRLVRGVVWVGSVGGDDQRFNWGPGTNAG